MPKRLLILEFNRGELVEKLPSIEELNPNAIQIILDEHLQKIWLWLGRDTSFLARRMVMRTIQTIKRFGYEKDGDRLEGLNEIVIVDEKDFTRADQQTHYETLKERIIQVSAAHEAAVDLAPTPTEEEPPYEPETQPSEPDTEELPEPPPLPPPEIDTVDETLIESEPSESVDQVPPVEDIPIPEPSESAGQEQTTPGIPETPANEITIETPHSPLTASERDLPSVDIKMGLLIAAILKEFPEIYISVHGSNVVIESAEGTLTIFRILDHELELSPDFDFKGKQESVISHYRTILSYFVTE